MLDIFVRAYEELFLVQYDVKQPFGVNANLFFSRPYLKGSLLSFHTCFAFSISDIYLSQTLIFGGVLINFLKKFTLGKS